MTTLEFLKKTQMIGAENDAMYEVKGFITALVEGQLSVLETRELQGLQESDREIAVMQACINRWPKSIGKRVDQIRAEMEKDSAKPPQG
jgi:hypothetical protein